MLPVIFSIGPFMLYTFVVVLCIAIFAGLFVVWKRGNELHYEAEELLDVVFVTLWWMFVAARVGYALIHFNDFGLNIGHWLNVFTKPGWYYPAGMIGAAMAIVMECKKRKWDTFQVLDIVATSMALVQAFMGLGTWLSGIGYGLPTTSVFGMQFSGVFDRRYPTQLLELVGFTACFVYLWWVESVYRTFSWYRKNKSQAASGFLIGVYLIWWGLLTVIANLFRTPQLVVAGIRFDVIIPLLFGIIGGGWLLASRSGTTWHSVFDYFGLVNKKTL